MIEIKRAKAEGNPVECRFTGEDARDIVDELYAGLTSLPGFLRGHIEGDIALAEELSRTLMVMNLALSRISMECFRIVEGMEGADAQESEEQTYKRQQEELRKAEDECE